MAKRFDTLTELQMAAYFYTQNVAGAAERMRAAVAAADRVGPLPPSIGRLQLACRLALEIVPVGTALDRRAAVARELGMIPAAAREPDLFSSAGVAVG